MAKQILAWQCRYCGAIKKTETIALRHELACLSNKDAHNCMLCEYQPSRSHECSKRGCMCSKAVSANCTFFKRRSLKLSHGYGGDEVE